MRKLIVALPLYVGMVAYGCSSTVKQSAMPPSEAGQAGAEEAGGSGGKGGGQAGASGRSSAAGEASGGTAGTLADAGAGGAPPPSDGGSGGEEAGAGGAAPMLPDGLIVDVPYTCASPFTGLDFPSYFYLENFEDGVLNTPGVSASSTNTSKASGSVTLIDSVDCDDGVIDGACPNCDALFSLNGSLEFTFDGAALGALPTHVGMVWTDGGFNSTVTVTGYDAAGGVIYTQTVVGIGDQSNTGTTAEDRFFGIVHYAGVKRVTLANSSGGIEVDHLQYGR